MLPPLFTKMLPAVANASRWERRSATGRRGSHRRNRATATGEKGLRSGERGDLSASAAMSVTRKATRRARQTVKTLVAGSVGISSLRFFRHSAVWSVSGRNAQRARQLPHDVRPLPMTTTLAEPSGLHGC